MCSLLVSRLLILVRSGDVTGCIVYSFDLAAAAAASSKKLSTLHTLVGSYTIRYAEGR